MQFIRFLNPIEYRGEFEYLKKQRRLEFIKTLILFALPAALFFIGYSVTERRANLMSVIAILGCLPACRSLVTLIMFMRYKTASEKIVEVAKRVDASIIVLMDCVFTTEKINYYCPMILIKGGNVAVYSDDAKFKTSDFEKYIKSVFSKERLDASVKVFNDLNKISERANSMAVLQNSIDEQIADCLRGIAL